MRMILICLAGREVTDHLNCIVKPMLARPSLLRGIARVAKGIFVVIALTAFLVACDSLHLEPDRELAPPGQVDKVWVPPASIKLADQASFRFQHLDLKENGVHGAYDLPSLVDLALRRNPGTQHAWYAAQAAEAGLGEERKPPTTRSSMGKPRGAISSFLFRIQVKPW